MLKFSLTIAAYVVVTLVVQAVSHFGINTAHYSSVSFLRPQPIAVLGVLASLIQGAALAYLFPYVRLRGSPMMQAVAFAWLAGAVLISYIALVEAAKYSVPSVSAWTAVEFGSGFAQFTLFGLLLGLIQRSASSSAASPATP